MEKPQSVIYSEIAIWCSLAIEALCSLVSKLLGDIGFDTFLFSIFICMILCIIPYKIGCGSNAMRYFFLILFVASILLTLGSVGGGLEFTKADIVSSVVSLPFEVIALIMLFKKESSEWFKAS